MADRDDILELLRAGQVARGEEALERWLATGPSADDIDLLRLELLGVEDEPPYRKAGAAQRLRFLLDGLAERHPTADRELDWAQTRLQWRLGLVEATQVACGVLLTFLRRAPDHLEAHLLYLQTVIDHEFYTDLGYPDRFAELRCSDDDRAALLLRWAHAEYQSYYTCTSMTDAARARYSSLVVDLLARARALAPALVWRDVEPMYWSSPDRESEADALAASFCAAELRHLRATVFRD